MKRLLLAGLLALLAPAGNAEQSGAAGATLAALERFTVPTHVPVASDYRQVYQWVAGPVFSGMHWDHQVVVYMSGDGETYLHNHAEYQRYYGYDELWDEEEPVPAFRAYAPGTVIVKENFQDHEHAPGRAASVTAMIKRLPGYDPEHGDWEYLEFSAAGILTLAGSSRRPEVNVRCVQCHANVAERDYVFAIHAAP